MRVKKMKQCGYLVLLIVSYCTLLCSQIPDTNWTQSYGTTSNDYCFTHIQTNDYGYLICMTINTVEDKDFSLIKTDTGGNVVWTQLFAWNSYDMAGEVQQTTDDGYIIAGASHSFNRGYPQAMLLKTDPIGDTLWMKLYADTSVFYSVQQTSDSGYIATGSWAPGYSDLLYLIKTDSHGEILWTQWYGAGWGEERGRKVRQTSDGGYIIVGETSSFGAGLLDIWLLKTDVNGDTLWTKTYGGSDYDLALGFSITSDGGYIIAGRTVSFGHGNQDGWLLRTNSVGDTLWTKCYGGPLNDQFRSVQQTTDGGFIAVGYTESFGYGDNDYYVVRTDAQGESLWATTYGASDYEKATSVQVDNDGGYSILGYSLSYNPYGEMDVWMVKTKSDSFGIHENKSLNQNSLVILPTIISGPLMLPPMSTYRIYNIAGENVGFHKLKPGIYFIEIDGIIKQKIIKIR